MRCKIVRFQKLMWRNMMRSTKSQKVSVLHYSIDIDIYIDSKYNVIIIGIKIITKLNLATNAFFYS